MLKLNIVLSFRWCSHGNNLQTGKVDFEILLWQSIALPATVQCSFFSSRDTVSEVKRSRRSYAKGLLALCSGSFYQD